MKRRGTAKFRLQQALLQLGMYLWLPGRRLQQRPRNDDNAEYYYYAFHRYTDIICSTLITFVPATTIVKV
jgi:uncharacterized iron-regulated membrane protein